MAGFMKIAKDLRLASLSLLDIEYTDFQLTACKGLGEKQQGQGRGNRGGGEVIRVGDLYMCAHTRCTYMYARTHAHNTHLIHPEQLILHSRLTGGLPEGDGESHLPADGSHHVIEVVPVGSQVGRWDDAMDKLLSRPNEHSTEGGGERVTENP